MSASPRWSGGLRRFRIALWLGAFAAAAYLLVRFETVTLPSEGCSPLLSISPGARLWIDVLPPETVLGDVVLCRESGSDNLLLGRIAEPPLELTGDAARALAGGALWIVGDHPSCPARDSRLLGPVERDAVAGRLVFVW